MEIPEGARTIIDVLARRGKEAYLVGGCVRDALLGRRPSDYDIATSATPQEVLSCFPRTIATGLKHGTVTVLMGKESYEVTTFRIDGEYADNRHPLSVTFTPSLAEDLRRRDFTINAMAYSPKEGLVDLFGGRQDLKGREIRAVGLARQRFQEDALRILRAIRFSAQLGFELEGKTEEACALEAFRLENVSSERIRDELMKILLSDHPEKLEEAYRLGLTRYFLPEFDSMMATTQETPYHRLDVGHHTLEAIGHAPKDKIIRLTMLFHDAGKPSTKTFDEKGIAHFYGHAFESAKIAGKALRRLKFPNAVVQEVFFLVLHHGDVVVPTEKAVRRAIAKIGKERFPAFLTIQEADILSQSDMARVDHLARLSAVEKLWEAEKDKAECFDLKDLAVDGNDLIACGVEKGPEIGKILNNMLKYVIDNPDKNEKGYLLNHLSSFSR